MKYVNEWLMNECMIIINKNNNRDDIENHETLSIYIQK